MNSEPSLRKRLSLILISITVLLAILLLPSGVLATPDRTNLESRKKNIQSQLSDLNARLDEAVEAYNYANYKLGTTKKRISRIQGEISSTEKEISKLESQISARARTLYTLDVQNFIGVLLGAEDFNEFITNWRMISNILGKETELNSAYKAKREKLERDRQELAKLLAEQKALAAKLKKNKNYIESRVREKERLLSSIDTSLREAIRQEELSRQRITAISRVTIPRTDTNERKVYVSRGASRGENGRAAEIALSLLGRPYRWGASGPYAFDCSGFTMYVYAQIGISLPHSSAAQYYCGARVSYDDLQEGDLVFFARRSGRISHVGIYIGGGNFVHAPQTGDVVKITSLSSHGGYAGAARP